MKKITIVGGGLAGCFTALEYGFNLRHEDIEVELLHDPTKKAEKVGAGSLMYLPQLLFSTTGFNWCANNLHATLKTGLTYEGWGKVNDKFVHAFPSNRVGMHFSPVEMQSYILNSGWFKVTEKKVTDINNIDSDFIVDCRGTPKDLSEYQELRNPLNACLLGKPNFNTFLPYTRNVATPDGYTFIIPTVPNSPSYQAAVGYLYNSDITSRKEAESNFLDLFDVEITGHKSFKSYVAKNPVENNRVFKNGNRLFFLEPLEATSTETYLHAADIYAGVMYGQNSVENANNYIKNYMFQIQNFILWHYQFGSKYDTPFWKYAQTLTYKDELLDKLIDLTTKVSFSDNLERTFGGINETPTYSLWAQYSVKNWNEGMNKKLTI